MDDREAYAKWCELVNAEERAFLQDHFGYVPVAEEHYVLAPAGLVVVRDNHLPRLYRDGCAGSFVQLRPA